MKQISSSQLSQTAPHPAGPGARQNGMFDEPPRRPASRRAGRKASGRRRRTCALSSDPEIGPVRIRPAAMRPALSANRDRVVVEKRRRVRGFRRSFCKPSPLFRCNPISVCRRTPPARAEGRRADFRSRKFTNFRTLTQTDPAVSRLSCSIVHELSDEQIARQPGRLKQSKAGPPKGAGRCGAGCLLEGEGARSGAGLPKRVAVRSG